MDIKDNDIGVLLDKLIAEGVPAMGCREDGNSVVVKATRDLTSAEVVKKNKIILDWKNGKLTIPSMAERMAAIEAAMLEMMLKE